ncbi:hypothetical protein WN944_004389 [Citrus x changshan-huyou]|uniref:Uncharacterized protein n=1 Tax=Citrus x changshan-huyou TaxID=2935761 RepID=A0AAP0QGA7_9ROSI
MGNDHHYNHHHHHHHHGDSPYDDPFLSHEVNGSNSFCIESAMNSICPNSPDLIEISDDEIMQNHDQNLQRDWGLGASAACQQQLLKDRGFLPLQQSLHPLFYRKKSPHT